MAGAFDDNVRAGFPKRHGIDRDVHATCRLRGANFCPRLVCRTGADKKGDPIVFLGWEPHPMNANFDMTYLTGGDEFFGPDLGGATVFTNTRAGYVGECENVGKLLNNLEFSLAMENEIMGAILDGGEDPDKAASAWLTANSDVLGGWLDGVTTKDGGDAMRAVKAVLGL